MVVITGLPHLDHFSVTERRSFCSVTERYISVIVSALLLLTVTLSHLFPSFLPLLNLGTWLLRLQTIETASSPLLIIILTNSLCQQISLGNGYFSKAGQCHRCQGQVAVTPAVQQPPTTDYRILSNITPGYKLHCAPTTPTTKLHAEVLKPGLTVFG